MSRHIRRRLAEALGVECEGFAMRKVESWRMAGVALMGAFLLLVSLIGQANALTSPWVEVHGGKLRLVSTGEVTPDGARMAGIEMKLDPGWKTYWRTPGEAGIAPQFDFSNSTGVDRLEVLYPAPERYNDGYANSIVYSEGVLLPVKIWPESATGTVTLSVSMFLGLCERICVPVDARLDLTIPGVKILDRPVMEAVARALARLPTKKATDHIRITDVALDENAGRPVARVRLSGDGFSESADLFAEAIDGSFIPVPERDRLEQDHAIFLVDLGNLDASRPTLRFTAVAGDIAIEREFTIDVSRSVAYVSP